MSAAPAGRLDARRRAALAAMGIAVWERRGGGTTVRAAGAALSPCASTGPAPDTADWAALEQRIAACTACDLHRGRQRTVFGTGDRQAALMVIGEGPGAEEDRQGEPFVGRAGQLLNAMLAAIGLARAQVYIANIVKCRPPGNRDPQAAEAATCRAYLERQIELVQPRAILAVGRIAAQNLLAVETPLGRLRGHVHAYGPGRLPLIVTYHPAYLLRKPADKGKAWDDLLVVRELLDGGAAS